MSRHLLPYNNRPISILLPRYVQTTFWHCTNPFNSFDYLLANLVILFMQRCKSQLVFQATGVGGCWRKTGTRNQFTHMPLPRFMLINRHALYSRRYNQSEASWKLNTYQHGDLQSTITLPVSQSDKPQLLSFHLALNNSSQRFILSS